MIYMYYIIRSNMYITKMYIVSLSTAFLLVLVPICFGNNDPMSTALWSRIEALERRDKEQSSKIDTLEQHLILSNKKLTIFSALNEDLQKDLAAKTQKLEKQDHIIATLMKDVELQKTEADENRRKFEILDLKVQTLDARLEETDKLFVQPDKNLEDINEIKAQLNGTVEKTDKDKHPSSQDLSTGQDKPDRTSRLPLEDLAKTGSGEKELRAIQANQEFTANRIHDRGTEITAVKLLGIITGNTPHKQVYENPKNRQIERHAIQRFVTNGVQEGPVAFHAVVSKNLVEHLGIDQNIVFDLVELNVGGGYHNQHGLFIAPKSGIYIFSTSILSYINAKAEFDVSIVKNGNILASAFGHGDSGRHDQGSVTVVTQLNVGDEISVKNKIHTDDSLWGNKFSSFMGILVIEM